MEFREYQHIERFGTDEVQGIELGEVFVFPKIDGTNASVWLNDGIVCAGSRRRKLSLISDNAGFYEHVLCDERIKAYLAAHPKHRLFGEWLVPHTLRTYREEAWRKFYIFDVTLDIGDDLEYLPYNVYQSMLDEFDLDYIPPLCVIKNGTYEQFIRWLGKNEFLIEDGKGAGEGIVLKNYAYRNQFGRVIWAKIVRTDFKELHTKTMGPPGVPGKALIEEQITNKYVTQSLINKVYANIVNESEWQSRQIPRLLQTVYYELIKEESWNFVKEFKNPTINYRVLHRFVINKIKSLKPEIFS